MAISFIPSIPPNDIRDIAFLFLLPAMLARIGFMVPPINRARNLFKGHTKSFIEAIRMLEIPGLRHYLIQESYLLIGPYLLAVVTFLFFIPTVPMDILSTNILIVICLGLAFWAAMDIYASWTNGQFVTSIVEDFENLPFAHNEGRKIVELLELVVETRQGLKVLKKKTGDAPKFVKDIADRVPLGGLKEVVQLVVGTIFHIVEKTAEYAESAKSTLASSVLNFVDKKIEARFKKYVHRTWGEVIIPLFWGLLPIIWLLIILEYHSGIPNIVILLEAVGQATEWSKDNWMIYLITVVFVFIVWWMRKK